MATANNAELREAVFEFHQYLSDRLAPLMVADSVALLLRYPAPAVAAEIERWIVYQQSGSPGVPTADFLFHAVKKVALIGEFELVSKDVLAKYLVDLSQAVLPYCPEADREVLRRNLEQLGEAAPGAQAVPPVILYRQGVASEPAQTKAGGPEAGQALSAEATLALRRLSLFLEHLRPQAATERREEVASQFVITAAARSSSEKELEESLAPLRQLGIDTESDSLLKTIARILPGWGSLPAPGGATPAAANAELTAMRQIVLLAEDEVEVGRRFRELVHAAIEQFNKGHLGRASMIFGLAHELIADQKVKPMFVESLRARGHEQLDFERLRKLAERVDSRQEVRAVLSFFPALQPDGLFKTLDGEPARERRRELLTLLEVHGSAARARAHDLLAASVERGANVDPFFQMNLVYLLRVIPRPADVSIEDEVNLVMRVSGKASPPPVVKQVIAYLAQTEHDKAERALVTYLRVFENMLLQPQTAVYPPEDIDSLLERTCTALARYGTPRALRALIDHGLKAESQLGSTVSRLVAAGHRDLSSHKDLLARLVTALKAELARSVLGFKLKKNEEKILSLVQALAGTPDPEVQDVLQEIANKYPKEKFGAAASNALAAWSADREAGPAAGLSGDLDLFGLPTVLQTLGQATLSGVLNLLNAQGTPEATLAFEAGKLRGARHGNLVGDEAVYQLFEKPFSGTFAFVSRNDIASQGPLGEPQDVLGLILEGVRRHDEWRRAAALVPDEARLKPTGKPWTGLEDEDSDFIHSVWSKVSSGVTAAGCDATSAADSYRVRRLLAHWVEEEAITIA